MTPGDFGLDKFSHDLNPAIVGMIRAWQGDPELDRLYHRLQARKKRRGILFPIQAVTTCIGNSFANSVSLR